MHSAVWTVTRNARANVCCGAVEAFSCWSIFLAIGYNEQLHAICSVRRTVWATDRRPFCTGPGHDPDSNANPPADRAPHGTRPLSRFQRAAFARPPGRRLGAGHDTRGESPFP